MSPTDHSHDDALAPPAPADDRLWVGRIGLFDDDYEPVLLDWWAPAARPFYVATAAHPEDMRDNLLSNMEQISQRLGELEMVLCFDCILRRLEAERLGIKGDLLPIFRRYKMIGFNTYGEQFRFLHLSQTLTGLAIGASS